MTTYRNGKQIHHCRGLGIGERMVMKAQQGTLVVIELLCILTTETQTYICDKTAQNVRMCVHAHTHNTNDK